MFLKPLMLAGLGAAVLPLVLHLLSKARYRTVDWGGMMFLEMGSVRPQPSAKLKQAAILALRMLMIAILAIAMARPVLRPGLTAGVEEARIHAIIILDRSASMAFEENARPRFLAAKQAVIHVLSNLRRGDEVSLILTGDPVDPGQAQPTTDLQAVAARVAQLSPSHGRADIAAALEQAQAAMAREPKVAHELYIISDRQATSWENVSDRFVNTWQQTQAQIASPLRCFVIPVGGEESDNVAIESIRLPGPPVVRDTPARVEVRLRNFGLVPRSNLPLAILANGNQIAETNVNLPANSVGTASAWVKFPASGSQVLAARLTSSGLRTDDEIERAIDVLDPARVLIITGDTRNGDASSTPKSADLIRLALAPHEASGEAGVDPAIARVIGVDDWWGISPDRDDVIILTDTGPLSDEQIRQLEQFVYGGGGLMIAPGNLTDIDSLNNDLYRDSEGFCPASVKPVAGDAPAARLAKVDAIHPIFEFLQDRSALPDAPIAKMLDLDDRAADSRVLARCDNGKPYLLEKPYGRGRVLMFTTSLGTTWNSLAMTNFYLPLVQSAARYLAGANLPDRNLRAGEPIELSFDHQPAETSAIVTLPNTQQRRVQATHAGSRWTVRYSETGAPGRYIVSMRGANPSNYIISPGRADSDPAPLSVARWEWLERSLSLRPLDPDSSTLANVVKAQRTGRELHVPLIACVIALALAEMVLARWWSAEA